jgi:type I restriction enzyme, S subunit
MDKRFGLKTDCIEDIINVLKLQPEVEEAIIFGSRAMGTYKNGSDIDIALKGEKITFDTISTIRLRLDELPYLYMYDIIDYKKISNPAVNAHIDELGITFYKKEEVPSDWKTYKLSEIAQIIGGGTPSTTIEEYWNGEIGWLTPRDLTGYTNKFISNGERNITEIGLKNSSARLMPIGAVLMTSRAPIGYIAIASKELCTNQGFKSFVVDEKKINKEFLYYSLKDNIDKIKSLGTGSTFAEVSGSILKDFEISIPNLPTQTQIVQILSSLDDKIELNLQMNQTLETMAQALFKEWFVNFNFPNFDGELENDLPKGWKKCQVKDICEANASTLNSKDVINEVHYIEISEVDRGIIKNISIYKRGEEPSRAKRKLKHGDTVLSTVRPNRGSYFLSIFPNENLIASTGFAVFSPVTVPFSYLYIFLTNDDQLEFYGKMADGAAYPAINQSVIMNMEVILPAKELLEKYHDVSGNLLIRIFDNLEANKILTQTRDTLLPKLMSGKLELV